MKFLKDSDKIADVVQRAISFALPDAYREAFMKHASQPGRRPSSSTLRYHELALDVALMLLEQEEYSPNCMRSNWSDSSFQAGYE